MIFRKEFDDECVKKFESDSKIGILCSVAGDGYPHMSLISSISVKSKTRLMWGQFSRGLFKDYLKDNPKTGFLVISSDQYCWTGKALHTGSVVKGEDYEYFNNKPLFRYNSYFGIGAAHYEDLVDVSAGEKLPLLKIALGACKSALLKGKVKAKEPEAGKMPLYGINLASQAGTLKFIAYTDSDGFPRLIPAIQGTAAGANHMVFSGLPYGNMLAEIPDGAKAAVFLANLSLESLLLQGHWRSLGRGKGGIFEIDKVYNSMLPISGYIYPPRGLPNVYGG
jgi:hypothetical protein